MHQSNDFDLTCDSVAVRSWFTHRITTRKYAPHRHTDLYWKSADRPPLAKRQTTSSNAHFMVLATSVPVIQACHVAQGRDHRSSGFRFFKSWWNQAETNDMVHHVQPNLESYEIWMKPTQSRWNLTRFGMVNLPIPGETWRKNTSNLMLNLPTSHRFAQWNWSWANRLRGGSPEGSLSTEVCWGWLRKGCRCIKLVQVEAIANR